MIVCYDDARREYFEATETLLEVSHMWYVLCLYVCEWIVDKMMKRMSQQKEEESMSKL